MAKAKEEKVLFPSLMSKLGIGGTTSGLLSDVTGSDGMSGVVPSLLNIGKKQESKKDAEIQRFSDPAKLIKKRRNLLIQSQDKDLAQDVDSSLMNYVTESGFFLDGRGKAYMQTGGKLYEAGEYDVDVHGLPVPLAKKGQRKNLTIAGFLRPSGSGALTNAEFERALKIINSTSPNEFIRQQRENILIQQSRFGV